MEVCVYIYILWLPIRYTMAHMLGVVDQSSPSLLSALCGCRGRGHKGTFKRREYRHEASCKYPGPPVMYIYT